MEYVYSSYIGAWDIGVNTGYNFYLFSILTMEQLFYRTKMWVILLLTTLMLLVYASIIYVIDPLQQFRLAKFYKPVYTSEIYQNPGLAKHYNYNTIIIGSSMTENFSPSYIREKMGWKTLKLPIAGANSFEEKDMLETAIASAKVKNVIYGLDIFKLAGTGPREGFPSYLYSSHSLTAKLKYLLNIGNIDFMLKIALSALGLAYESKSNLDNAYTWNNPSNFSQNNVMKAWKEQLEYPNKKVYSVFELKDNFNKNVLAIIKQNPNTNFYLFFPPYSILTYKIYAQEGNLLTFLQLKKYVVESSKNLPNIKIYDFQAEYRITKNLNNYADTSHYSGKINNYIVDNLQGKKYLVTEKNIDDFIVQLLRQVKTT